MNHQQSTSISGKPEPENLRGEGVPPSSPHVCRFQQTAADAPAMTTLDTTDPPTVPLGRDYPEIRDGVRAICAKYPDKYWRELEDKDEYADAFVAELSAPGYLGAL